MRGLAGQNESSRLRVWCSLGPRTWARGNAGLLRTELALRTAEMIEHNGDRRGGDEVLDRGDHREIREQLNMPIAVLDAFDRSLKTRPAHGRVVDAAGCEIEPDAADARLFLALPHRLRRLGKARLLRTELALRTPEMIEHNGDRRGGDEGLDRRDHREIRGQLNVPI